jgi:DNA-binding transcriptional MerR regulator
MNCRFSIKDLEKLSGIKAHTLRIWEQRYGILNPERTDTNIRWYCNDKLKHLLNVTFLYEHGYKISKIATLKHSEVVSEVNRIVDAKINICDQVRGLVLAMVEMDEQRFEKIVSANIKQHGFSYTIEKIISPFLSKINVLWQTNSINSAQELFMTSLIRQKLIAEIDKVRIPKNDQAKKIMLFLPLGEKHELNLLYLNYLLRSQGHNITYIGQSVPLDDLKKVVEIKEPEYLISVFSKFNEKDPFFRELSSSFPQKNIFLFDSQLVDKISTLPENVKCFNCPQNLTELVSKTILNTL